MRLQITLYESVTCQAANLKKIRLLRLSIGCRLKLLVCFTRITKRDTKLNHPHPVEARSRPKTLNFNVGLFRTTN
jgi:hypothetical protein